jgi:tetratricopeptide (TPR) repeat protein
VSGETFDVFLSHNSQNKPAVRRIAEALKDRGLKVWLDEWELIPGRRWIPALEKAIQTTKTAAVLVGENGLGPWEQPEYESSLSEFVDRGLPVIPVLLPGAPDKPKLPLFLRGFGWVDLRGGITEEGLDRLEWGITGKRPTDKDAIRETTNHTATAPRYHNIPFLSLGDLLKGRDEELHRLITNLQSSARATAITQAISGLGGIGKTRLAAEYALRSGDRYDAALFVVADSPETLQSGLAGLIRIGLPDLSPLSSPSQAEEVSAFLQWLRDHKRWLLILDNVDTQEAAKAVREILPNLGNGHVLITSRRRDWPAAVRRQPLGELTKEEATQFLLHRTGDSRTPVADDAEQADRLAEILGGLPLALEQAAAYIVHHQTSFAGYLKDWEREREKVLEWYDATVMDYPAPVAVTWQKTFQQLSPIAAAILRLTAFLAPEPIPEAMFEEGEDLVQEAAAVLEEELGQETAGSVHDGLADLAAYSMGTRSTGNLIVHRIVQEVLRARIPQGRRRGWLEFSLRLVDDYSPPESGDVRVWPVWDLLRPHISTVLRSADEARIARPTSRLMNELEQYLAAKGLYSEAEPLIRRALAIEEELGSDPTRIAIRLNNLASLFKATNRLTEAEPLMRRVVQIMEASLGSNHPNVATALNNWATLLQATNRLTEAEPLMRRALEIDESSFGPYHPNVARDLNNLATLLQATNRLTEAEPLMRRALEIDESSFGPHHPDVAIDLNNLAQLLKATNRLSEAEPLMRRTLEIDETSFGPHHPNVAIALNNLASLLQATNRVAEAEPLMRRALEIGETTLGPNHPNVAIRLNNLAQLLQAINRLTEAEPLMRRALEIDETSFGPHHPDVATDLNNLAQLLKATNRVAEAEPLMRRALEIDEASFGPHHPDVAIDLNNLALLLKATNRLEEAEPLMRRAVTIYEASFGPDHPRTQNARMNLEALLREMGPS